MTLPDERYRAVVQTQRFLLELLTTPRIPKAVKDQARGCLRHYPSDYELERIADNCPEFLDKISFSDRMYLNTTQK